MTEYDAPRIAIVSDLLALNGSLDDIATKLASLEWDYDGQCVVLKKLDLINVLQRYLREDISAHEVERWANLIEGREDIQFEQHDVDKIESVLHELSNPLLTTPLDRARAEMLVKELLSG